MAPPGDLDTSFSGDGRRTIDFGGIDAARTVLVRPDGRIVVAGTGGTPSAFCVARLRPGGSLDPSFGDGGRRRIAFGSGEDSFGGAALRPDGRILLAGSSGARVAVARLTPDGARDRTFAGDGRKTFSWGGLGHASAVLALPGGKLLLAGFAGPEGGDVRVARLTGRGALDTTFGNAGVAGVDFGGDDFGNALARPPDGRLVVAGLSTVAGAIVARLRAGGGLDSSFDGDGRLSLGAGRLSAVLVQPDGRIVLAGNLGTLDAMSVTRLLPGGAPDPGFGQSGTATIDFGSLIDLAGGAALQPDGRIVVVGSNQSGGDFAIARLGPDGKPDATFGNAGKATVDFGDAAFASAVALQPDGRIVVAGQKTGTDDFAVARLLG